MGYRMSFFKKKMITKIPKREFREKREEISAQNTDMSAFLVHTVEMIPNSLGRQRYEWREMLIRQKLG